MACLALAIGGWLRILSAKAKGDAFELQPAGLIDHAMIDQRVDACFVQSKRNAYPTVATLFGKMPPMIGFVMRFGM